MSNLPISSYLLLSVTRAFSVNIYRQLGATYGFNVLELPALVIYPKQQSKRVAYLELDPKTAIHTEENLSRSRLIMDEDLYDVCMKVDKTGAALAFVLSHEMAHFYLNHATFRSFAEKKKSPMSDTLSQRQEKEADQTGLLFAYLAGYDPEFVITALFNGLYRHYHLTDPLPGHPSKAYRQKAAKRKANEFRNYGYLFAVGQALYCRERFAEAASCFKRILSKYRLKEAYSNFGVCRLQQALRLQPKALSNYFAFPFEFDPLNRLLLLDQRSETINTVQVTDVLAEANAAFGQALAMDKRYRSAYLNQSIGYLLDGNPEHALGTLVDLDRLPGVTFPSNGYLLRGIAYALSNKSNCQFRRGHSSAGLSGDI